MVNEIITKATMLVMGISIHTTNENGQAQQDIPEAWQRFATENVMDKIPNRKNDTIYGIYTKYEGDFTKPYILFIGCEVNEWGQVPEGLEVLEIPATEYSVVNAIGTPPVSIQEAWQKIWASDIDRAYTHDMEVYDQRYFDTPPQVDLLISVK